MIKRAYAVEFFYTTEEDFKSACTLAKKLGGDCSFEVSICSGSIIQNIAKATFDDKAKFESFKMSLGIND